MEKIILVRVIVLVLTLIQIQFQFFTIILILIRIINKWIITIFFRLIIIWIRPRQTADSQLSDRTVNKSISKRITKKKPMKLHYIYIISLQRKEKREKRRKCKLIDIYIPTLCLGFLSYPIITLKSNILTSEPLSLD